MYGKQKIFLLAKALHKDGQAKELSQPL